MQSTTARLSRIAPEIPVQNLQSALDCYVGQLGFQLTLTMPQANYAIVERDEIALHLFEDASRSHSPVGLHIFTPDLDELSAEFVGRGVQLTQPIERKPWGNREFRIKDNSGNELKFTEPLGED